MCRGPPRTDGNKDGGTSSPYHADQAPSSLLSDGKEKEIGRLIDDLQRLQTNLNTLKESSASKIAQLEDLLAEKDRIINELGDKLLRQQDYEDLKRELGLFKSMKMCPPPPWLIPAPGTESPPPNLTKKSLEALLMSKTKTEGTPYRSSKTEPAVSPPHHLSAPFSSLESFGSLLGEELASTYTTAVSDTPPAMASLERLQEGLRQNIDKYAHESLNTLNISRCVRELLSVNNIGQRLFAKYVLGLSQGTVSELLSKPKPWDKLTEKGRDSYRKMHAWASDEACIFMLKSLVPRKESTTFKSEESVESIVSRGLSGGSGDGPTPPAKTESPVSMNGTKKEEEPADDSAPEESSPRGPSYPPNGFGFRGRPAKKYENDDISQEMVTRIYQEEMLKLRSHPENFRREHYERTHEEIRQALAIYHQELARLAQVSPSSFPRGAFPNPLFAMGLNGGYGVHEDLPIDATIPSRARQEQDLRHHGSAFSLVRPKGEPTSKGGSGDSGGMFSGESPQATPGPGGDDQGPASASPLQRMQSITNSLLSQPSLPALPSPSQRPAKAILPPITQQQFDQYNNLNTEDIVKKVKEQLSQYSISQRLFGESVLGLSQGSVSDLLARPKPWHMLTQKGREPFIRMKIFLEDDNAVHKLVASQYKIAPEKLMRTGSYGSPATAAKAAGDLPTSAHVPPGPLSYLQPSVYEMAALTTDLDTQSITIKIKETLMAHNIGQKIFGEAVLGLSQGSVSELLSKPKPWHMLSIKGREPFIRMQLWLNDPHNVEKLQALKSERREANKRRRTTSDTPELMMRPVSGGNPSPTSVPSQGVPQGNVPTSHGGAVNLTNPPPAFSFAFAPPSPYPPAKKPRVLFSEEQKQALRLAFSMDPYPSTANIEFLAAELGLSVRTITNWFHNHRMRLKQHHSSSSLDDKGSGSSSNESLRDSSSNFDPVQFRLMLGQRLAELCRIPPQYQRSPMPADEDMSGLDLTISRTHQSDDTSDSDGSVIPSPPPQSASAKRRKPAAPQWVNPDSDGGPTDDEDLEDEEDDRIINGVCVRQTPATDRDYDPTPPTVCVQPDFEENSRRTNIEKLEQRLLQQRDIPEDGEDWEF
ncbi:CUX2 [Cordylochernes scorpioides]|uniref:Homeobox protein cut-like n=1 Tax=Cordylochernes scorpioides TaxID=51811 RepID=A0ABY6KL22_9ARAC|nr:CUX2 [Cordylochernes scorpioides]